MCDRKSVSGCYWIYRRYNPKYLSPQIYKIIKTKEVENISYLWQFMYIIGIILSFMGSITIYYLSIFLVL